MGSGTICGLGPSLRASECILHGKAGLTVVEYCMRKNQIGFTHGLGPESETKRTDS